MKKFLCVFCFLFSVFYSHAFAEGTYYIVSAYYSPKPDQEFYLHGSYQEEVSMNGEGINTASGKPVKIGSVAAPKEIPYNTRVHIQQTIVINGADYNFLFNGTVTDRGGAIHSKSGLPRLDIYMGEGQDGLCRAINFGVQTMYVTTDNDTSLPDTADLNGISAKCSNPHNETVPLASGAKRVFDPFTMTIGAGSPPEDIKAVQTLLSKINAYTGPIDGIYDDDFVEAIYQFQKGEGLVQSRLENGAGYYGPKTRAMLRVLTSGESNKSTPVVTQPATKPAIIPATPSATIDSGTDVSELQTMLKELGYFKYEVNGVHNKRLVDSIYAFQLAKNIVSDENDPGAGYYGPVTKQTLQEAYKLVQAKKEEILALEKKIEAAKQKIEEERAEKKAEFLAMMKKIPQAKIGMVDPQIRVLQKILKEQGYMTQKDTAIFGQVTKNALAKYQLKLGMIGSLNGKYAGVLGDRTREAIAQDLYEKWVKKDTDREIPVTELMEQLETLKKS